MKVLIGLSGGVDSSVAAALLKESGHDVTAFTLILGKSECDGVQRCCAPNDLRDARAIASILGIPHYVWDYQDLFRQEVYEPFLAAYRSGRTPNPCGQCNRSVRFGAVLERAIRLGFDALSTGHYARAENGSLFRALDRQKDQSYFLSRIRSDAFSRLIFPLAHLTKARVRNIASELGLPTSEKPDSQEICFVSGRTSEFLSARLGARPGEIVDRSGRVVGRHGGIHQFTLGQRRGIGLSGSVPLYVTALDAVSNRVTVGGKSDAFRDKVSLIDSNFLASPREIMSIPVRAQLRYRSDPVEVSAAQVDGDRMELQFAVPAFAPAPGQIAVLYSGDRVLSSGLIAA